MKITKSGHRKARLINQKIVQEKFMKNVCNYIVLLRKQQKNLIINIQWNIQIRTFSRNLARS